MYSGTTLRTRSGNVLGAHQKLDRVARRHLAATLPEGIHFPTIRHILHFEGKNGPDGIKSKSPGRDELWHYIDPDDQDDTKLLELIEDHITNLTRALVDDSHERAAFEAAWLAHAVVDGLTPAHHYPLEDKIEELWGIPHEERITIRDKNIIRGTGYRDTVSKNWQYWGAKGIFTTHFMFEFGVATAIAPMKLDSAKPTADQYVRVERDGIRPLFLNELHTVYDLGMYEEFARKGWTRHLGQLTRQKLAPTIVRAITLAWYSAAQRAAVQKARRRS